MKILYGVQGTGNGHITRARIMAKALAKVDAQVDWVFSGRAASDFFDMQAFGDYQVYRGLTFATKSGRVLYGKTLMTSNLRQLYADINKVNVEGYDYIINDFEPVSAWAARRAGKEVIGISHQNAFHYAIPKTGSNVFVEWFMRKFAPVTLPIGLHWHHFNQPILPPMVEPSHYPNQNTPGHYLVYLPFAGLDDIMPQLRQLPEYQFYVYQPVPKAFDEGHIHVRPFSREGFQKDLHSVEGVICSAGFELPSESIQLGKKLLVQPVKGQMEQQSNALALEKLGYGSVAKDLHVETLAAWLRKPGRPPVAFPDVAGALVDWLAHTPDQKPDEKSLELLQARLWQQQAEPNQVQQHTTSVLAG